MDILAKMSRKTGMQPSPEMTQACLAMMVPEARRSGVDRESGGDVVGDFVFCQGSFKDGADPFALPVHSVILNLLFFAEKILGAGGEQVLLFFRLFSRGFLRNCVFWRGVLMVRLRWMDGETWCFGRVLLAGGKHANFRRFSCGKELALRGRRPLRGVYTGFAPASRWSADISSRPTGAPTKRGIHVTK